MDLLATLLASGDEADYAVALDLCEQEGWVLDTGVPYHWAWATSHYSSVTGYSCRSVAVDVPGAVLQWRSVAGTTCSIAALYVFAYMLSTRCSRLTHRLRE